LALLGDQFGVVGNFYPPELSLIGVHEAFLPLLSCLSLDYDLLILTISYNLK